MCVSGTTNCAGAAANGARGTAAAPGGAAAVAVATTALSTRAAAAFCRICGVLNVGQVLDMRMRCGLELGRRAAWVVPGRRRVAQARSGGVLGLCQARWGQQRRSRGSCGAAIRSMRAGSGRGPRRQAARAPGVGDAMAERHVHKCNTQRTGYVEIDPIHEA